VLSLPHIAQLVCFSVLLACGQILFKVAASSLPPLNSVASLTSLFVNPWIYFAVLLYGAATLLWIFILQQVPLSSAYPFVALGFVIIPLASWVIFKEPLNLFYCMGVALVIAGLGMITMMSGK